MSFTVVGIGELLWDVFPGWRRMGGAPVNFACHCRQLGARGLPVSCLGMDQNGDELQRAVAELGLEVDYLQLSSHAPTGTVKVELDAEGKPRYEIREGVAWDFIGMDDGLRALSPTVDAVCFGSLAQRWDVSRETIRQFVDACPARAIKIFDINLRQPFYTASVVRASLELANVLKVSDEELPYLASLFGLRGPVLDQIRMLIDLFKLRLVVNTRGADGSLLVTADALADSPGCKPKVVDTVGAGDSYTAALCMGLLRGWSLEDIIQHASRVSAFVCEQQGATPVLPDSLVSESHAGAHGTA